MAILELKDLKYSYDNKKNILRSINVQMEEGKMYAVLGASGSGKTTLLSLLAGLDTPTGGQILYNGENIENINLIKHRRNQVAIIFQNYNLIDYLNPLENVALTSKLSPYTILKQLGLHDNEIKRNVLKLSGGQQQRVAIARALASDAKIILADEPTGNLDADTAEEIIAIFKDSAHKSGKCVIVVTHSNEVAAASDVIFHLKRGELHISDRYGKVR